MNGQRETANAFLVNGGDVSEGRNQGAGLIPNLDSIEEFRLITNGFDAEYGKYSGSVMNAITKSGTNAFHGDVFEFLRNDHFDARGFFDPTKAELRRNQFGYTAGGPFMKNKLFWFTDYQGTQQVAGASTGLVAVPSADERSGIFDPTTFVDANGNLMSLQGDYWAQVLSQRLGYTVHNGEPYSFPGCDNSSCVFPNGVIPQRAFAKPAIGILPYIPAPNQSNGYYANSSQKNSVSDNKFGERIDFLNQKTGNWSFYYHLDNTSVNSALPTGHQRARFSIFHSYPCSDVFTGQYEDVRPDSGQRVSGELFPDRNPNGRAGGQLCQPFESRLRDRSRHLRHYSFGPSWFPADSPAYLLQ